jgi:hypothetical protein
MRRRYTRRNNEQLIEQIIDDFMEAHGCRPSRYTIARRYDELIAAHGAQAQGAQVGPDQDQDIDEEGLAEAL